MVKPKASALKYLSMKLFIPGPYFHIIHEIIKKRADLLTKEANKNIKMFIWKTPDVIVNTL